MLGTFVSKPYQSKSCDASPSVAATSLRVPVICGCLLLAQSMNWFADISASHAGISLLVVAKLGLRFLTFLIMLHWFARNWQRPACRLAIHLLLPWVVFGAWATITAAWSPYRALSFVQAWSFIIFLMYAAAIGVLTQGSAQLESVVKFLTLSLAGVSCATVGLHAINPALSGLVRDESFRIQHGAGLIDPTVAGALGALGLLSITFAAFIWRYSWAAKCLVPALAGHICILLLANSRAALGGTAIVLIAGSARHAPRFILAALMLFVGFGTLAYVCCDPHLELVSQGADKVSHFLDRGQDRAETTGSVNGRTELWSVVWEHYSRRPFTGHGYQALSPTGLIDVWGGPLRTHAHNILFQVLATTGLIGLVLWLWGLGRPLLRLLHAYASRLADYRVVHFVLLLFAWIFLFGLINVSFMGPPSIEGVVFFTLLGLALAQLIHPSSTREREGRQRDNLFAAMSSRTRRI